MELLTLILLYYLSQKPEFAETVKPLMAQLKNSQQLLDFINNLSKFSEAFSPKQPQPCEEKKHEEKREENKKPPQSPTAGIADDFIEQILEGYLKNTK